jgi:hypothetical protein
MKKIGVTAVATILALSFMVVVLYYENMSAICGGGRADAAFNLGINNTDEHTTALFVAQV